MSRVYLGRMDLSWCHRCEVPVIRGVRCPACGSKTDKVKYTPPGDVKPAFPYDINEARTLADEQWGSKAGETLLSAQGPYLINPCPAKDRLDEIISGGRVIADIAFDINTLGSKLLLKEEGGKILMSHGFTPEKGLVTADGGAISHLMEGKNLMSPGITDADPNIRFGDEVLVLDPDGKIIGSGSARKRGEELPGSRGQGVKMRWAARSDERTTNGSRWGGSEWEEIWDSVVDVNKPLLKNLEEEAVNFISKTVERFDLPVAVSFSGGKDSLATLLLCIEAGLDPPILFVDTGIEFPETVEYVHDISERMDLELMEESPTTHFLENFPAFGPPGRDFRWCCKTNKLGPMTRLIKNNFPGGVLTFIGQRRFESSGRRRKGAIWKNPWVPSQTGASPVQDWNALDVWLYIFKSRSPYNPLYESGFERIGCWLCPSTDLAERELLENSDLDTSEWDNALEEERRSRGLPREWIDYGFHRFRRLPPHMRELARKLEITDILNEARRKKSIDSPLLLVDGSRSCRTGLTREGVISDEVPWDILANLSNILGDVRKLKDVEGIELHPVGWKAERPSIEIFRDGAVVIRAKDEDDMERRSKDLISVVTRASGCIGCGICVGRCPEGALSIEFGKARIDTERCLHCGKCLGPCPAEDFRTDPFEI